MGPKEHLFISGVSAIAWYAVSNDLLTSLSLFGAGILPDTDHVLEYLAYRKKEGNLREFLSGRYFEKKGTIYVLFHSMELLILLFLITLFMYLQNGNTWIWRFVASITTGYVLHLALDYIGNPIRPLGYFLINRIFLRWKLDKICK
jgi:hypothetical protein